MPQRPDDLLGRRFGKLLVIRRLPKSKNKTYALRTRYLCQCDCGNRCVIPRVYLVRKNHPRRDCNACGLKLPIKPTHHPEYMIWKMMIMRCTDERHHSYPLYGGRGITVCERWLVSFDTFLADVGYRPSPTMTIDRIDNNRGYEPGNVKWATAKEQRANQRA